MSAGDALRDLLRMAGCEYGQLYLFARPLPPEEFETFLIEAPPLF